MIFCHKLESFNTHFITTTKNLGHVFLNTYFYVPAHTSSPEVFTGTVENLTTGEQSLFSSWDTSTDPLRIIKGVDKDSFKQQADILMGKQKIRFSIYPTKTFRNSSTTAPQR